MNTLNFFNNQKSFLVWHFSLKCLKLLDILNLTQPSSEPYLLPTDGSKAEGSF